jgi:hypothetical protein
MAALLARASKDSSTVLEWSEADKIVLDRAADTADRAQLLRQQFAEVLGAGESVNQAVNLSSEIRLLDRLVVELVTRLEVGVIPKAVSERHQRAARARWGTSA